jgi:Spy/CpxP family protein refolding chaperone
MKTSTIRNTMAGLAALAVIASGATVLAGKCQGYGAGNPGCGHYQRDGGCGQRAGNPNLTAEQREQLAAERQAFMAATQTQRRDLYAKQMALMAEIAKSDPDPEAAAALQKEISQLAGDLDQKRLTHIMAMRKIDPEAGLGVLMEGRGMGQHGRGYGGCRQ